MLINIKKRFFLFSIPVLSSVFGLGGGMTINSILENGNNLDHMKINSILKVESNIEQNEKSDFLNIKDILERGGESSYVSDINLKTYCDLPPHKGEKILYLTFDDGPMRGTEAVLKILEEENVDATMFLVAGNVVRNLHLFKKELLMPNVMVANHTYSHASGHYAHFYSNKYNVLCDVEHAQMLIGGRKYLRLAGRNVWRVPGKERDDYGIKKRRREIERRDYDALKRDGFFIYGWDVEWHFDRKGKMRGSAEEMANHVESVLRRNRTVKKGKVVLLAHDFMFRNSHSVNELRKFVKIMKSRGWKFEQIDKYLDDKMPDPMLTAKYYRPKKLNRREAICISTRKETEESMARAKAHKNDAISIRKILASAPLINNTPYFINNKKYIYSNINMKHKETISDKIPKNGSDVLTKAILEKDSEKFYKLIDAVNPNAPDSQGRLAINCAIIINDMDIVKELIAKGCRLDIRDRDGLTPLLTARKYRRYEMERYLAGVMTKNGILVAKLD